MVCTNSKVCNMCNHLSASFIIGIHTFIIIPSLATVDYMIFIYTTTNNKWLLKHTSCHRSEIVPKVVYIQIPTSFSVSAIYISDLRMHNAIDAWYCNRSKDKVVCVWENDSHCNRLVVAWSFLMPHRICWHSYDVSPKGCIGPWAHAISIFEY